MRGRDEPVRLERIEDDRLAVCLRRSFVEDENGVVVARHIGGGDAATWEALAEQL